MRIYIHQVLTCGSVFPQGPYDFCFWFDGTAPPINADRRAVASIVAPTHAIDVPDEWTLERDNDGTGWLYDSDEGRALEAEEALIGTLIGSEPRIRYITRDGWPASHAAICGLRQLQGARMDALMRCTVTPGQFSDELAITGEDFSLFAPRKFVELEQEPGMNRPVQGWLHVEVIEQGPEKALVRLPNEAFEIGYFVQVDVDRLKTRPRGQPTRP